MKRARQLLVPVLLLVLFNYVLPSNPDSVIVQDSSADKDSGEKSAPLLSADSQTPLGRADSQTPSGRADSQPPSGRADSQAPLRRVDSQAPFRRADNEDLLRSADSQTPLGRADSQTPLGRADSQTPLGRADSQTPLRRADSQTPLGRADSQTPLGRADSQTPLRRADSQTPLGRADSQAPLRRSDSQAPFRRADNEDPLRSADSQSRSFSESSGYTGVSRVIVLRPYVSGPRIIWREVLPVSIDRVRDRNPLFSVWRGSSNNRPDFVVPNDNKNSTGVNSESAFRGNRPENPQSNGGESKFEVPQTANAEDFMDEMMPNDGKSAMDVSSGMSVNSYRPQRRQNYGGGSNNNGPQISEGESAGNFPSPAVNNGEMNGPSYRGGYNGQNGRNNGAQNPSAFSLDLNAGEINYRRQFNPGSNNRGTSKTNNWGRPFSPGPPLPPPVRNNPNNAPGNIATTPNRRVTPDSNLFAGIVNDFAFKLVETLNLETNFVISPLSIFIALSMCYLGSDGNTKAQLEQALGMNDNAVHGEHLHQGIKDLISLIMPGSSGYQLFVANGMFLGKNFTTDPRFEENIRKYYSAELQNVDFGNPQTSFPVINDWVAKNTRNMITNLIDTPPPLQTRLILLNAIYFKGIWKMQFPRNMTYNGRFHTLDGANKEVPTMTLSRETFPFYRSDEHRHSFIKLPYSGDQISMIIALPYTEFEKPMPSVRDQILCYVQDAMTNTRLDRVAIPKFRLEHARSLRRPLMQLGISDLFSRNADLRKLRQQNDLYVSAILHKAVVDVNEEGTTAAAVTSVEFVPLSYRNTTDFIARHPFAFYIVHEPSGLVLFYGKIFDIGDDAGAAQSNRMSVRPPRPNAERRGDSAENRNPSRVRLHGAVNYENID